jgi:hypothetical protein
MDKPNFPAVKPKLSIELEAELTADFDTYSNGSICMTMDASDVSDISLNGQKIGTVSYAIGGGVSVQIGERHYLVSFKDVFEAVYKAEQKTTEHIETLPVTDRELLRRFGLGARQCSACGKVYQVKDIPTIEEGCKGNMCKNNKSTK